MATYESWDIAGYREAGEWRDVENGDPPLLPEDGELDSSITRMTVHFVTEDGSHAYATLNGPWDDWDSLYDLIDDIDVDKYVVG